MSDLWDKNKSAIRRIQNSAASPLADPAELSRAKCQLMRQMIAEMNDEVFEGFLAGYSISNVISLLVASMDHGYREEWIRGMAMQYPEQFREVARNLAACGEA